MLKKPVAATPHDQIPTVSAQQPNLYFDGKRRVRGKSKKGTRQWDASVSSFHANPTENQPKGQPEPLMTKSLQRGYCDQEIVVARIIQKKVQCYR